MGLSDKPRRGGSNLKTLFCDVLALLLVPMLLAMFTGIIPFPVINLIEYFKQLRHAQTILIITASVCKFSDMSDNQPPVCL